jgi:hypothetical protein
MALTQALVDERKAVLRRFKELLEAQRAKFREYLNVLEKQSGTIENENAEAILAHTELEEHIVGSILTLQKVIKPVEAMYHEIVSPGGLAADTHAVSAVSALQTDLESLQKQVLERNEKNRELLKTHLLQIRQKLNTFNNPYRNMKSVYAASAEYSASLVQIDA